MNNSRIDRQIKSLQSMKHTNTIKRNVKANCYDTLFFTYEAEYKKKVHFAYLASTNYDRYAILCQEDERLSSHFDEGHPLDITEFTDEAWEDVAEILTQAAILIRAEVAEEILSQMALERCDPDVMAYFEDYYWLPKSVWQALKEGRMPDEKHNS